MILPLSARSISKSQIPARGTADIGKLVSSTVARAAANTQVTLNLYEASIDDSKSKACSGVDMEGEDLAGVATRDFGKWLSGGGCGRTMVRECERGSRGRRGGTERGRDGGDDGQRRLHARQ
jgi:hypothetical protein